MEGKDLSGTESSSNDKVTDRRAVSSKIASGLIWKFAERGLSQGVSFLITLVLARILEPTDYGLVSLITIFTAIANVFVTSGFSSALIQRKGAGEVEFSSVFWCSMAASIFIYLLLFFGAPIAAEFYKEPTLTAVMRTYSIIIIIYAFNAIQSAFVSRQMQFKKFFYATLIGTLFGGVIGVSLAVLGYGVWALVAQALVSAFVNTLVLFFVVPWKPRLIFSVEAAASLMDYGWKILASELLSTVCNNLRSMLLGSIYTLNDLAYFNRGQQFPDAISGNVNPTITSVLFPAMSQLADDQSRVRGILRRSIGITAYVMFPLMAGLAIMAPQIVDVLLTQKWAGCIPFIQLVALTRAIEVLTVQSVQALKALGMSDVTLRLELVRKPIFVLTLVVGASISVLAVGISWPIYSAMSFGINVYFNKKYFAYDVCDQLSDIMPSAAIAMGMAACMLSVSMLPLGSFELLVVESVTGIASYFALSEVFRIDPYLYLRSAVIKRFQVK